MSKFYQLAKIILLIHLVLLGSILLFGCDSIMNPKNEGGYVTYKISIESDMDSLSVSFFNPLSVETIKNNIYQFPWSYEYTDSYSGSSDWLIKGCQDTGYIKIVFYSGEIENINKLVFRDSVRYYSPFTDFRIGLNSYDKINYNFNIITDDSIIIKLGYYATWSPYDIDTIIIDSWSFTEFQDSHYKYKGLIINPTASNKSIFELISSGKIGRNYDTIRVTENAEIHFQVTEGLLKIIE